MSGRLTPGQTLIVALLLTAGCALKSSDLPAARPADIILSIVTWNMNESRGDLSRLIADLETGRVTGAPAGNYVLLLQEATDNGTNGVTAIAGARHLSVYFSPVRSGRRGSTGNAIIATGPLMETRTVELPRARQPRAAVAATMDVNGARLFFVSAHLENRLSWLRGLFGDVARGRQAAALLEALPADAPGVVGGDMNTMLGSNEPAWRMLEQRFADTPRDRPEPTFRDRLVLDHVFFDLPDGWQAMRRVLPDRYGSDHHPVLGVIVKGG